MEKKERQSFVDWSIPFLLTSGIVLISTFVAYSLLFKYFSPFSTGWMISLLISIVGSIFILYGIYRWGIFLRRQFIELKYDNVKEKDFVRKYKISSAIILLLIFVIILSFVGMEKLTLSYKLGFLVAAFILVKINRYILRHLLKRKS